MIKKISTFFISGPCAIAALICATIAWFFKPNDLVPVWSIYVLVVIFFIVFAILRVYYDIKSNDKILLEIKAIVIEDNSIYFLTTNSNLLLQDTLLTITYTDNDIEKVFAIGYVMNIKNSSGYSQIDVLRLSRFGDTLFQKVNNLNSLKKNFSIRMSLTKQYFINMED